MKLLIKSNLLFLLINSYIIYLDFLSLRKFMAYQGNSHGNLITDHTVNEMVLREPQQMLINNNGQQLINNKYCYFFIIFILFWLSENAFTLLINNHKSLENKIITPETELQGMKGRIQEIEHVKQSMVQVNDTLKSEIKNLKEQLHNNSSLNNAENKLDIKPTKEEINKLIVLDNECHERALHLIIAGIEEQNNEDTLEIVNKQLKTKSQIQTTYLTKEIRVGKIF